MYPNHSVSAARARGARNARQYAIYELVEDEAGKFARLPDVKFSIEAVQCANIEDAEPDCDGFKQATSDLCPACDGGIR